MNETTPPNDTTPPAEPRQAGTSDRFFSWLRGLGVVRSDDRWFAGVASGIAAKANIDPIIVRGVFVVLAVLGGPGILLYIAAWLLLPDSLGRIQLEQLFRGQASAATTTIAVLLGVLVVLPLLFWSLRAIFSGPWAWGLPDFWPDWVQVTLGVVWWAVIVPAGIIWLVVWLSTRAGRGSQPPAHPTPHGQSHHSASFTTSSQGETFAAATSGGNPQAEGEASSPSFAEQANQFAESAGQKAEQWGQQFSEKADQWGQQASEKSREWEQWGRDYHERYGLSAGFVAVSLALALIAGGLSAAITFSLTEHTATTLVLGLVAAVAVLALAMILAGVRGKDSGWLGFLAICGVIVLIFAPVSSLLPQHTEFVPFGNTVMVVTPNDDDRASVKVGGNTTVDLGELTRSSEASEIDVWLLGGNVTVRLPETHATTVHVNLLAGNVRDERLASAERRQGGIFVSRTFTHGVSTSSSATADAATVVNIHLMGGNIYLEESTPDTRAAAEREEQLRTDEERREREIERLEQQIKELERAA
ncbi:MAG: PspC domain-containing protein [Leucobacter sp.]|nr:PspC domain-containing protein [Leucobacter sp.]